jgi:large subunit ribosomal protein L25
VKKDITVAAEVRLSRGKNEARRTRVAGRIPAVVYGAFQNPVAISVDPRDILRIVRSSTGYNTIFNLAIAGYDPTPVMVVDQQYDPLKGTLLHTDLKRIDLTKRLRVTVPVLTQGEPKGVKIQGGLLEVVTRSAEIECLPDEIPEHFTVDVSELMIGQAVRAGEIAMPASIKLLSPADAVIAHCVALRAEAAPAAEEAAPAEAGAEPEVIKKGKGEEEAAEDKDKGKKK